MIRSMGSLLDDIMKMGNSRPCWRNCRKTDKLLPSAMVPMINKVGAALSAKAAFKPSGLVKVLTVNPDLLKMFACNCKLRGSLSTSHKTFFMDWVNLKTTNIQNFQIILYLTNKFSL